MRCLYINSYNEKTSDTIRENNTVIAVGKNHYADSNSSSGIPVNLTFKIKQNELDRTETTDRRS